MVRPVRRRHRNSQTSRNGPSSTPTFYKGKVIAVSVNSTVACLDAANGLGTVEEGGLHRRLWREDAHVGLQRFGLRGRRQSDLQFPCGSKAAMAALKLTDGAVIWSTKLSSGGDGCGYSSPIKATYIHGVPPMYVVLLGKQSELVGFPAESGKATSGSTRASAATGGVAQIPIPIVKDDHVWVSCSYSPPGAGAALLEIVAEVDGRIRSEGDQSVRKAGTEQPPRRHGPGRRLHLLRPRSERPVNRSASSSRRARFKWGGPEQQYLSRGQGVGRRPLRRRPVSTSRYENGKMVLIEPRTRRRS